MCAEVNSAAMAPISEIVRGRNRKLVDAGPKSRRRIVEQHQLFSRIDDSAVPFQYAGRADWQTDNSVDRGVREAKQFLVLPVFVEAAVDDLENRRLMVLERSDNASEFLPGPVAGRPSRTGRRALSPPLGR
jgi:hypothetical protein